MGTAIKEFLQTLKLSVIVSREPNCAPDLLALTLTRN